MSTLNEKDASRWQESDEARLVQEDKPMSISMSPAPSTSSGDSDPKLVIFSVSFYIVAAIVMVMANKAVLNAIPIPMFFLFCQLVIAVLLLQLTAALGYFQLPKIQVQTARAIAPLIGINCTGLIFNTYCLKYVDASFYQVARGLVLPFTVFFSYALLSAKCSRSVLAAVVIVCIGFFWGVSGESLSGSRLGISLGILSSVTTSVHAIVIKKSLAAVKGSTLDLAYLNNVLSAICVAPIVLFMNETPTILEMISAGGPQMQTFLYGTIITGLFGFLINLAGFLSIKVTSPVSHMISAAVRGVIQTFLGMFLFGDVISFDRIMGIFWILFGSIWYTYAKAQESTTGGPMLPLNSASSSPILSIKSPVIERNLSAPSMVQANSISRRGSPAEISVSAFSREDLETGNLLIPSCKEAERVKDA